MRIIDPDESEEEIEVRRRPRGRPSRTSQAAVAQRRIVDPDESDEQAEVRPRPRSRQNRTSQSAEAAAPQRPRQRPRRIETIEEEDDDANETTTRQSGRRPNRFSQSAEAAAPQRPRQRPRRIEVIEEEDANETTNRQSRRHHNRHHDEDVEERPSQSSGKTSDSICDAVLAAFSLSSKGPIKEVDFKPLLGRVRYKDWEDGLNELNIALSNAFGFTLVYDGTARLFFLRNDLFEIKSELSEMFEYGTLNQVRIDDGTVSKRSKPFTENEFNDDDKKGLLFTILASIMMSNNVEMGHKNWAVEEEIVKHMCIETMGISDVVFEKLLSGKNAEFIKEGWLRKKEELIGDNSYLYHYSWGPRAVGTVSTSKVFKKFCMINQTPELEWGNYKEILKKLDEKNDLYNPR